MNKKLISLLVAICLVIGLLPVASVATDTEVATAKLAIKQVNVANTLEVTEGGEPIYGKSVEFDAYSSTGASKGKGYDYTTEGVSSADWNFKFEYPLGGQPTLTLNNFKLVLTDETGNPLYTDNGDGTYTSKGASTVGIASRNQAIDLKVVLQGENVIWTNNGIIQADTSATNKLNSLTIEGEDGGSLAGRGKAIGIRSRYGVPVTIKNAVMDLTVNSTTATAAPIYVANADITIENSTLSLNNLKDSGTVCAIHAEGTGVINVENSDLELTATGTAFNKAPTVSPALSDECWSAVAGDDAASAVAVTDAAVLAAKKYVKMTYTAPVPTTEATSEPTTEATSEPTTEATAAPTAPTTASTGTTAATTPTVKTDKIKVGAGASAKEVTADNSGNSAYFYNTTYSYGTGLAYLGNYNTDKEADAAAAEKGGWTLKFGFPADGNPTVYLNGAVIDYYKGDELVLNGETKLYGANAYNKTLAFLTTVNDGTVNPLDIVIQKDSRIFCGSTMLSDGSNYVGEITITSVGDAKLTARASKGFTTYYDDIVLNANIEMNVPTYNGENTSHFCAQKGGDIIVNGGNYKLYASDLRVGTGSWTGAPGAVFRGYGDGCNIVINGGTFDIDTGYYASTGSGAFTNEGASSTITINGGTFDITTWNLSGFYSKNNPVVMNGGHIVADLGRWFAESGVATKMIIKGGTVDVYGIGTGGDSGVVVTAGSIDLSGYANCDIKAGASKIAATLRESIPSAKYIYVGPHTHVWGEAEAVTADCAGAGATKRTCTGCGAIEAYVEVAGTGAHNVVIDAAVPATCYQSGLTEGSHCGDCGVVIVEQKTVLPTGHTNLADAVLSILSDRYEYTVSCKDCGDPVIHKAIVYQSTEHPVDKLNLGDTKKATCSEEGYQIITISCATCTENINTHTIILPKNPSAHTKALTAHPAVAPDYGQDGNIAYWSCDDCGKYFADAAGTQQLEKDSWILYALCNHTGGTATCYTKATCRLCGRPYGKFADHTPDADDSDCTTPILCSIPECRAVVTEGMPHTGGTATCIALANCEVCGTAYGKYAAHKGGTATCKELAKCEVCGADHGNYAKHKANPDDGNLETPVTCSVCAQELGLPAPGGAVIDTPDIRYGYNNLKLANYNEPKYLVSYSYTTEDTDGVEFTAWKATATGANEDNYNLKFYWNAGDPNPTIILRGYKWDQFNEETEKIESTKNSTTGEYTGKGVTEYPMILLGDLAYDIILTGEDSYIGGQFGIYYTGELSIKSEGNTKLEMHSMAGCLAAWTSSDASGKGDNLIIDANLNMTSHGYYNAILGSAVISTYDADVIINGGNVICQTGEKAKSGIVAREGGDIIINGGKVVAHSVLGTSMTTGAIYTPAGKVIINGGIVETSSASTLGIYGAQGIDIKGGTVQYYSPYFGMNVGAEANINITGGMVEIISENGAFNKMPVLGAGIAGYAGDTIRDTKAYDNEANFKAKYVKIGLNVTAPDPANGPTMPGADPNNPGENPAAPEIEPTASPTAAPGMKLPRAVSVKVGGVDMRITKYDTPVYVVNTPVEYRDQSTTDGDNVIEGNLFQGMKPTITTDADNWNAMFVWKSTEGIPTLYLNGLIIDDYNEETSKWREYANKKTDAAHTTGIATPDGRYMRIVLTGEDSVIKTRFGVNFKSKLRLESEGDTKLTCWNLSGAIYGAARMPLVVNANLDLHVQSYYNGPISHPLMTANADLTINGGNINISLGGDRMASIIARDGGNVIINGGNITAVGTAGTSPTNGAIQSNEKIIINGGTVNATAKSAVAMYAKKGIDITGGIVNLTSPYYALSAGSTSEIVTITVTGGTTTLIGQFAVYNKGAIVAVDPSMYAYAGAGARSAEVYDGTNTKLLAKPWMLITDDENKKINLDDVEDEEIEIPFDPTDAPTESTDPAATDPTADPDATGATDATEATEATTPEDEVPEEEIPEDDNYYNVTPNLNITGGISDEIPDALIDLGIDSADMIRDILVENVWAVDDYSDYFAFFTITLMYHDGEDWVEAGEEHFPEDGYITAMLPYPEGTDIDTPFTAVHMFTKDAFGLTPGEVELLAPINTDEGILVELSGLSPVAIAWEGLAEENPPTGDTGIGMYVALMVVALLGMATTVVLDKKRKTR